MDQLLRHNLTPRDVTEKRRGTVMGRSRGKGMQSFGAPRANRALRSPTAIRRPDAVGWFPGSGVGPS